MNDYECDRPLVKPVEAAPPYKRWFEEETAKTRHLERVLELLVVAKFVTREKLDDAKRLMA